MVCGPTENILRFVAHHLGPNADQMFIYLDELNRRAFRALPQHPKVRVQVCDDTFWKKRKRNHPDKHQLRRTAHATFTQVGICVTSRTVVWVFVEQFWFEFVPVFHCLQGRLAAQG